MTHERPIQPPEQFPPQGPPPFSQWSPYVDDSEPEIDIMEYVRLVWSRKWLVLGVLLATVVLASRTGLPVSTTHIAVGAVIGVGLARGIGAIDLRVIGSIVVSWVVTLPVGAALSALFFFTLKGMFT